MAGLRSKILIPIVIVIIWNTFWLIFFSNPTHKYIASSNDQDIETERPAKLEDHLKSVWEENKEEASKWLKYLPKEARPFNYIYHPFFNESDEYRCPNDGKGIKLLIIVSTAPNRMHQRMNIRKTYGLHKFLPGVKIVFFIGASDKHEVEEDLLTENQIFKDIVRFDLMENYNRLTHKTVAILEYVMKKCAQVEFAVKVDDDIYINVPALLNYIDDHKDESRKLYGFPFVEKKTIRNRQSKFRIKHVAYRGSDFPKFLNGPFYMMKSDLIPELYITALETKYFRLEDVFLTGFVALQLGLELVAMEGIYPNLEEFKNISDIDYVICYVMHEKTDLIFDLWKAEPNINKNLTLI